MPPSRFGWRGAGAASSIMPVSSGGGVSVDFRPPSFRGSGGGTGLSRGSGMARLLRPTNAASGPVFLILDLVVIADQGQRPGLDPVQLGPARQGLLPAMGGPD